MIDEISINPHFAEDDIRLDLPVSGRLYIVYMHRKG